MGKLSVSGRQRFLDERTDGKRERADSETIKCLNWNVRNPSLRRATKQMSWFEKNNFDVIVLIEVKPSEGGIHIRDRLASLGYNVTFQRPENEDYGVLLAVRKALKEKPDVRTDVLPYRVASVLCDFSGKSLLLTGTYVPIWRDERKSKFLEAFERLLSNNTLRNRCDGWIILGDMNVLEPSHIPHYPAYEEYEFFYNAFSKNDLTDAYRFFHPSKREYSWFGRSGNGYRPDHIFVSKSLLPLLTDCSYIHEPRTERLSDHSAMYLEIKPL